MPNSIKTEICPRCNKHELDENGRNAVSRRDNKTQICSKIYSNKINNKILNFQIKFKIPLLKLIKILILKINKILIKLTENQTKIKAN